MHGERFLIGLEHDAHRSAGCLNLIRDRLAVFLGASDEGSRLVGHVTPNEWRVLQCRAGQGLPVEIVRRLIAADVFFEVLPLRLRRRSARFDRRPNGPRYGPWAFRSTGSEGGSSRFWEGATYRQRRGSRQTASETRRGHWDVPKAFACAWN